jgi:transposase
VPEIGKILRLVLLAELHDMQRFPRVQTCVSSGRLGTGAKDSAGKRYGTTGATSGKASLTWACSEAAVLLLRDHPAGQQYLTRLEKKHGPGKALTLLAQQLGRAVYAMLKRQKAFELDPLLQGE